ncbi:unnamed protein product [Rotaria magnacalcarata]|uniref:Uncharacterized protein n=2 Tax=Rotaria magnacalcarata TaxID=392030 RepID=A0A816XUV8_9BILA|nr:unnamed protein product [Rotaria magnacalcarata]CAF3954846.1 unnamed protein product [Rotaria magnacalcarata]CAF3993447.1 unnamed protein product [Rotaria magnacalcarata]
MTNNNTASNNFTIEDYSTPSAPVGMALKDSTLTSNKSMLLPNNDLEMKTDNIFATPIAPDIDDLPSNYFDTSIVPNGAILYYNDVTPYTESSKAEIQRYEKTYTEMESYEDFDGTYQTRSVKNSRVVPEFSFSIDLSPYICEQWQRVAVIPSGKARIAGEIVTFRDALEQYTLSNKKIKEIVLKKQCHGWNLEELKKKLIALVRSTGYQNSINVTYNRVNYQIAARSSSKLSQFANSTVVHVLCCISCLCIIFGPIHYCLHTIGSARNTIVAEYMMMKSDDIFLQLNAQIIVNSVIQRSRNSYIAHFT